VSLGIIAEGTVNGQPTGTTVTAVDGKLEVALRVAAPSWVRPERARVVLSGRIVAEEPVTAVEGKPTDVRLKFAVPAPAHDAWLVCVVTGAGVKTPHWQHCAQAYTLASTNPVYVDGDRDGHYASPRAQAEALFDRAAGDAEKLMAAIRDHDDAVAVQLLARAFAELPAAACERLERYAASSAPPRPGLREMAGRRAPQVR
jgi:hypothetical protein